MVNLPARIFFTAFFINLLYELLHSVLYKTRIKAPLPKYFYLILKAAIFDGFLITVIYYLVYFFFNNFTVLPPLGFQAYNPFNNYLQIVAFLLISLIFAYLWEVYSVKNKRWEYSDKMPLIFRAGITPVIQLALTGFLSLYLAFNF